MKIYTKTGDDGNTALYGGTRVPKHDIRIASYGTVDELNSWIGLLRDQEALGLHKDNLLNIQNHLFKIGAILATETPGNTSDSQRTVHSIQQIKPNDILFLEKCIDTMNDELPTLKHFILPGGHTVVSYCHISRTVCRRAERITALLLKNEPVDQKVLAYLNRLSDYLFVLARKLSQELQANEIKWIPDKKG